MLVLLHRLAIDIRANVATLFAAVAPILIGVAALAVDEASLHLEKRRLQSAADLAAIHAAGDPADAAERVERALLDAGYDPLPPTVLVQTDHYSPDPNLGPADRFAPDTGPANAARVTLRHPGRVHFASIFGFQSPSLGVSATASATPMAAWSIGSRLASLNDGLLNAILGGLLGGEISLSLMNYDQIIGLDVGLLDFLDALALELGLTAGTYSDLLDTQVSLGDIGVALASAAGNNAVLLELASLIDDSITVDMARLIVADGLANLALGTSAAVKASVDALGLLTAAALVADGERHVSLDLGLNVAGLTGIDVDLVIGEPPHGGWFTLSGEGAYLRTAQTRLRLDISLLENDADLGLLSVGLPVYVELAPAEAHLASLTCPPGRPDLGRATVAARPGVLRLAVGHTAQSSFLDTRRPLAIEKTTILSLLGGLVRVTAYADVSMSQTSPVPLHFTAADAVAGKVYTARTTTPLSELTTSLLSDLELDLEIIGINLLGGLLSGLLGTVSALIAPVIGVLDHVLVAILDVLGIGIGEVDVALHGFDCRNAALVQ
ncbi:pilus assembly protein TadG-related protein [Pelagibacterium sp. 26DY04]|uniref:TadG family pilus assembly protein n=1 Tax=Pelagibacterium sp. 26DY04 TaxID=2967130 RepID=UPI002816182B|nr:TadG family pilus assembly protein [Pelagibacterium sp. 26DY04]WMT87131.1 pilus assembly protein TadG-related protein [Pelagibacterium sp. 26DY04]